MEFLISVLRILSSFMNTACFVYVLMLQRTFFSIPLLAVLLYLSVTDHHVLNFIVTLKISALVRSSTVRVAQV